MLWPNQFNGNGDSTKSNSDNFKHHEHTPAAQNCFKSDVSKMSQFFSEDNPFLDTLSDDLAPIPLDHSAIRLVSIVLYE